MNTKTMKTKQQKHNYKKLSEDWIKNEEKITKHLQQKEECKHKGGYILNAVKGCKNCANKTTEAFEQKEDWKEEFWDLFRAQSLNDNEYGWSWSNWLVNPLLVKDLFERVLSQEREKIVKDLKESEVKNE